MSGGERLEISFISVSAPAIKGIVGYARRYREACPDIVFHIHHLFGGRKATRADAERMCSDISASDLLILDLMGADGDLVSRIAPALQGSEAQRIVINRLGPVSHRLGGYDEKRFKTDPEDARNIELFIQFFRRCDPGDIDSAMNIVLKRYFGYDALPDPAAFTDAEDVCIKDPVTGRACHSYGDYIAGNDRWVDGRRKVALLFNGSNYPSDTNSALSEVASKIEGFANVLPIAFNRYGCEDTSKLRGLIGEKPDVILVDPPRKGLDPAVIEEGNGMRLDPKYDIFDPANGYDKNGANYSPEFIRMYQKAQRERNERLIDFALDRLAKIQRGEGDYVDDEPFMITAADQPKPNNRLLPEDLHLLAHTKGEYDLLHGDGTITHERIQCLRTPEMDRCFSSTYGMGVNKNTIKGFLSSQAIRTTEDFAVTEDDVLGVDWHSSYASPIGNIEHISVPALFVGMTGGYEYMASELIYNHAKMADKKIAFVRGASHNFVPNFDAEKVYGSFGDTEGTLFDYIAAWMKKFA